MTNSPFQPLLSGIEEDSFASSILITSRARSAFRLVDIISAVRDFKSYSAAAGELLNGLRCTHQVRVYATSSKRRFLVWESKDRSNHFVASISERDLVLRDLT